LDDVIGSSNDVLCFTILLRCVGTREKQLGAKGEEEISGECVAKLFSIVALDRGESSVLWCTCRDIGTEMSNFCTRGKAHSDECNHLKKQDNTCC
jgi:hypothetical protein